jgi:hypothetical protein
MVRAGGQKKAQGVKTLARVSGIPEKDVQATIDKLRAEPLNLVKEVPSKVGSLYELHHDVMAFAVQDWSVRKQGEIRERWHRRKWALVSLGVVMLCGGVLQWGAARDRERQEMEIRNHIAVAQKQLAKIASQIGVSGTPLIGKAGLLGAIDLYAWVRRQGIPVSEDILVALYLAPEQRDKSVPLGPREAIERQVDVSRRIPALTVPSGRFTLMIEERNTPVLFDHDRGKVEYLSPLDSPIIQIGFSESLTSVGVQCLDGWRLSGTFQTSLEAQKLVSHSKRH